MLRFSLYTALVLSLLFAGSGCRRAQRVSAPAEPHPQQTVIREIQEFEKSFGFEATGSFSRHSPGKQAFYRCYYVEKLKLPDSYSGLRIKDGSPQGCNVEEQRYDVFFYRIEAVASPKTPTTEALAEASLERLAVVVPHEDYHQQKSVRRLPGTLGEASATLVGFLTGAEYAKTFHGADSALSKNLAGEAETFLAKAEIVNRFHARLSTVYAQANAGKISRATALSEKQRLFEELKQSCEAITPNPSSFNKCPPAMNNAGLAFDHTYTKHYALMYRLALGHGKDVRSLVETLSQLPAASGRSEENAVTYLERIVKQRQPAPAG
jgi:hypothetical protein